MIKHVSGLLLVMALSGCNYFSTSEYIPETENRPIIPGNARGMITEAAKNRGYETVWDIKGNYSLSDSDLMNIKGKSFGEALVIFQNIFTQNNLKLEVHQDLNGKKLGYQPYVLFLVCNNHLFAKEFSAQEYPQYKNALKNGLLEGCTNPIQAFPEKKKINQTVEVNQQPINQVSSQSNVSTNPSQINPNFKHAPEDLTDEAYDINNLDFKNIAITPEFIKTLEQESGQKFDMQKYQENLRKQQK